MRRIKISALHREGAKLLAERARRIPGEVGYYEESYLLYISRGSLYIDYLRVAPWQVGGNSDEDRLARKVNFKEAMRLLTSPEEWGGEGVLLIYEDYPESMLSHTRGEYCPPGEGREALLQAITYTRKYQLTRRYQLEALETAPHGPQEPIEFVGTVDSKGRVTLPAQVRKLLAIAGSDVVELAVVRVFPYSPSSSSSSSSYGDE